MQERHCCPHWLVTPPCVCHHLLAVGSCCMFTFAHQPGSYFCFLSPGTQDFLAYTCSQSFFRLTCGSLPWAHNPLHSWFAPDCCSFQHALTYELSQGTLRFLLACPPSPVLLDVCMTFVMLSSWVKLWDVLGVFLHPERSVTLPEGLSLYGIRWLWVWVSPLTCMCMHASPLCVFNNFSNLVQHLHIADIKWFQLPWDSKLKFKWS